MNGLRAKFCIFASNFLPEFRESGDGQVLVMQPSQFTLKTYGKTGSVEDDTSPLYSPFSHHQPSFNCTNMTGVKQRKKFCSRHPSLTLEIWEGDENECVRHGTSGLLDEPRRHTLIKRPSGQSLIRHPHISIVTRYWLVQTGRLADDSPSPHEGKIRN